jgi:signal transduction histidine kinase
LNQRLLLLRGGFAALLVISAAQVGWWMLDQWWYADQVREQITALHQERAQVAGAMLANGMTPRAVEALLPDVTVAADGTVGLSSEILAELDEERRSRHNRYLWEGIFFLVVLLGSITVIGRALQDDARLRRRQQNFLAAVSHEFKSPLSAARLAAETMALRDLDADARSVHLDRVLRGMRRLEMLIENLLDSARIDAGAVELRPATRSAPQTLEAVLPGFRRRAGERQIEFVVEVPEDLVVYADDLALCTVIRNLLENAFEAVRAAPAPRVRLHGEEAGGKVVLAVVDNGVGFPPQEAAALFEQFYRPGDELRRGGRGAGLGLHIVNSLMRSSGGRVEGTSPGTDLGAEFRTYWPRGANS